MKHNFFFIILICFSTSICLAATTIGIITHETITGGMTERDPLNYVADQQVYTTGGITFTYPAGWFDVPPFVQVSLIQNSSHPTTETYTTEISANTATSTTIMAYQISSGLVSEAPNGSLIIYLLAIADPV